METKECRYPRHHFLTDAREDRGRDFRRYSSAMVTSCSEATRDCHSSHHSPKNPHLSFDWISATVTRPYRYKNTSAKRSPNNHLLHAHNTQSSFFQQCPKLVVLVQLVDVIGSSERFSLKSYTVSWGL